MARENRKNRVISYENSIKKSNELSMAKMNQGLSLNQMQLFAFAIFSTQQDGKTEFRKYEFEKMFNIDQLRPDDAMDDAYRLLDLKIQMRDSNSEKGRGHFQHELSSPKVIEESEDHVALSVIQTTTDLTGENEEIVDVVEHELIKENGKFKIELSRPGE